MIEDGAVIGDFNPASEITLIGDQIYHTLQQMEKVD